MNETEMIESVQAALHDLGRPESVAAVGQFEPRGHSGAMFAGGLAGDEAGAALGGVADSLGTVGGALAGARFHDAASGLPANMLVAVTDGYVHGFAATGRRALGGLVFSLPRESLSVTIHGRVNVRVLELVDSASGASIELEGNRLPVTHSNDVIEALHAPISGSRRSEP